MSEREYTDVTIVYRDANTLHVTAIFYNHGILGDKTVHSVRWMIDPVGDLYFAIGNQDKWNSFDEGDGTWSNLIKDWLADRELLNL